MLPTAMRRRLTLTIMCALLMTMSLLLTAPLHTAFAQKSSLALERAFTADANGRGKNSFAPGDAIRYYAAITNSSGTFTVTPMYGIKFIGGRTWQHTSAVEAWELATSWLIGARSEAGKAVKTPTDKQFITWFGAYNRNRASYVKSNFDKFYKSMKEDLYTIDFSASDSSRTKNDCSTHPTALAYTNWRSAARTIWLCRPFWTLPLNGKESRSATLLHEVTHDVAHTEDYKYGQPDCKDLAAKDPNKAIHNAANYKYFAYASPPPPPPPR